MFSKDIWRQDWRTHFLELGGGPGRSCRGLRLSMLRFVMVCYGLFQLSRDVWNVFQIAAKHCKTLQNSAHGRAGMDFMKKIQKVWMNMNAVPMRRMCLLSFWCWHLILLMPRPFSCASNVEQCSNMVPDGTSILQHTIAYSKQCFKWDYMRLHHLDSFGEVLHIVEMAKGRWWNEVLRCS